MAAVIPFRTRSELADGERLGERIAELNAYLNVAQAEFLELLREFDDRRYWEELGFCSCAHWLNLKCGLGFNAARERLRMARALGSVPKIRAAFAEGRLSFSKVRAMTRIANEENEDLLLNIARHGTAYHVERFVTQYRRIERLEEAGHAQAVYERRELNVRHDEDGAMVITARLPAEDGELVLRALERAMERQEIERAVNEAAPSGDREPVATRQADALREMAETYLNDSANAGSTADRYQVVVHVRDDSKKASIGNAPGVSAETSERLSCDASVTTITENSAGETLNIGRRSRTIPPPMRRALQARDGGCRFPGCTRQHFCDGHHIRHWQHGGETSLDNLVLLCRHHHRLVHEGGFDCRRKDNGEVHFIDRQHRRLADREPTDAVTLEATLAWMHRRFGDLGLDGDSCRAEWYAGDRMDWDHAMFVAFADRDRRKHPPETSAETRDCDAR